MRRRALVFALLAACAIPAWPCHHPDNIVNNCGFQADVTSGLWVNSAGTCTHVASPSASETGAASCDGGFTGINFGTTMRQCTDNAVPGTYGFGFKAQLVSGTGVMCFAQISAHDDDGCVGGNTGGGTTALFAPDGTYDPSPLTTFVAGLNTTSIDIGIFCSAAADFVVLYDDVYAGVGPLVPVELQSFAVE